MHLKMVKMEPEEENAS